MKKKQAVVENHISDCHKSSVVLEVKNFTGYYLCVNCKQYCNPVRNK